jgi:uncharacterized protein YjbJ (UPF0337 family)
MLLLSREERRRNVNEHTREGFLQRMRGKIKSTWGDLTDDELDRFSGNLDQLVGWIRQKTGEAEDSIRSRLRRMEEDEKAPSERRM